MSDKLKLKFGLVINPFAGIGGKVGLKGSDGNEIRKEAFARGAVQQAINRAKLALEPLSQYAEKIEWYSISDNMGADLLNELGFESTTVYQANQPSEAFDTVNSVKALNEHDLDLLVFVGGDGTARNVCESVKASQVVLGIPAGVKIHSGVYAITPNAAALVMEQVIQNQLVSIIEASVMDIDEDAFRQGNVRAKQYGTLLVPAEHQYIQSTKVSSSQLNREDESLVQADIAEFVTESMEDDYHYLVGSGTSCAAVMQVLDLPNTLLGIDWVHQQQLVASDLNESQILDVLAKHPSKVKIIITVIGGQGHIIGRGNQQLSSRVLSQIKKDDLIIIATKSKINQLETKPLIVDSDDSEINHRFSGLFRVITGYDDEIYYQVGFEK